MTNSDKVRTSTRRLLGGRRAVRPLLAVFAVAVGMGSMQVHADVISVKVFFNGACPEGVSIPEILVEKKNKTQISWVSYNMDGTAAREDQNFSIFFDPFKNSELTSKNGELLSSKLGDANVPSALYKYTIVGDGCPDSPLDPNIRLR